MSIFDELQYFTINENWGDPDRMNGYLLLMLDRIRDLVGNSFVIHCGFEGTGHATKSKHYTGDAVDFHIESKDSFDKQVEMMQYYLKFLNIEDHCGFGVYPFWNHKGFHLDIRESKGRWGRLKDGTYVGIQEALNHFKK